VTADGTQFQEFTRPRTVEVGCLGRQLARTVREVQPDVLIVCGFSGQREYHSKSVCWPIEGEERRRFKGSN